MRGHEQAGERPVLILSHDVFNERSGTVIAVALTSQEPKAGYPLTLELRTPRLPKRSWVNLEQRSDAPHNLRQGPDTNPIRARRLPSGSCGG